MRITAKLAYNQIKNNRQRTKWTLIGIALSTALITAVCSFAASGNALLVYIYGKNYGEQGGKRMLLLLIPVIILSAIIISMAVVVISNAFRVSAGEQRAQFGILKSVGTTKQQITATVLYESVFLSLMGIPVGIILGLVLAFAGVQIANQFFDDLNSLVHLMMNELIIVIEFVISWQAILTAVLLSFFTVLLSAWLPARKAAKVTAIDSIRKVDEARIEVKKMRTSGLTEKLFGVEGVLAAKNMKRSKRNLRASVISLTVSIVLFICLSSLSVQLDKMLKYIYSYSNGAVMVDYASGYDTQINKVTGKEQLPMTAPIDSKTAESITENLRQYKGAAIFGAGCDMYTYTASIPDNMLTSEMKKAVFSAEETAHELEVEIITVDSTNYALLCEQAGVPVGSNILMNRYLYNDSGNAVIMEPFDLKNQDLQLNRADGTTETIHIQGELKPEDVPANLLYPNTKILRLIVPEGDMRTYSWEADTDEVEGFIDFANTVMSEQFSKDKDSKYMEEGFTTRVYKMQDYVKVMNIVLELGKVFVQSFVVLLALIGLTNVISTMSTNVQMRSREFAVLQSIGMTREGVRRMIRFESIICSVKSLIIGLPLATVLTYLINIPIREMFPIPYQFPLAAVLCCTAVIFIITGGTMWISSTRLQQNSIAVTIRSEN